MVFRNYYRTRVLPKHHAEPLRSSPQKHCSPALIIELMFGASASSSICCSPSLTYLVKNTGWRLVSGQSRRNSTILSKPCAFWMRSSNSTNKIGRSQIYSIATPTSTAISNHYPPSKSYCHRCFKPTWPAPINTNCPSTPKTQQPSKNSTDTSLAELITYYLVSSLNAMKRRARL